MVLKGLLCVSFGTSYEETRIKTIDAVEDLLKRTFDDYAFYSAWTSNMIIAKVARERDEHHDTLEEAFERLSQDGITEVTIATMCLLRGGEWNKIARYARAWMDEAPGRTVRLAEPLLTSQADRHAIAQTLAGAFAHVPANDKVLFMGHGTEVGSNEVYSQLQDAMQQLGENRFIVATVEGTPKLADVIDDIAAATPECVHLAPLMIVAGDHARNDLAGDDDDSWQSQLHARGIKTKVVLRGLGEYDGVQDLVYEHARLANKLASA